MSDSPGRGRPKKATPMKMLSDKLRARVDEIREAIHTDTEATEAQTLEVIIKAIEEIENE